MSPSPRPHRPRFTAWLPSRSFAGAAFACVILTAPALVMVGDAAAMHTPRGEQFAQSITDSDSFTLPINDPETSAYHGEPASFEMAALIDGPTQQQLDMRSIQIEPVTGSLGSDGQQPTISADGRTVTLPGIGTWQVIDTRVQFTPLADLESPQQSINVSIAALDGRRSEPSALTVRYPYAPDIHARASEGVAVRVELPTDPTLIREGSVQFTLDGLPPSSVLTADARRLIIPGEGTWQVLDGTNTIEFVPRRERLGKQLTPITYTMADSLGNMVGPSTVTVDVPFVVDVVHSSPFGTPVEFQLSEYTNNIELDTLELHPWSEDAITSIDSTGTTVNVMFEGTWHLDRANGVLVFVPEGPMVRDVTPMGLQGRDANGNVSAVAPVSVGYPQLPVISRTFTWGSPATFTPLSGALYVQESSFTFDDAWMPDGTRLEAQGRRMIVPGEGVWELNPSTLVVTFTPEPELQDSPHSATYTVTGIHSDNTASSSLTAVYASEVPVARDDDTRINATGSSLVIDVLGNDTAASPGEALDPTTLELRSPFATNLPDLDAGTGRRLVVPDEGTFLVTDSGAVEFTPMPGFRGRTRPIEYMVTDGQGRTASARITVEVTQIAEGPASGQRDSGINALLGRLLPSGSATEFSMYASITALLSLTGLVLVWVGRQIERDDP